MKYIKTLLAIAMLSTLGLAKSNFISYDDMCEKLDNQECANNLQEVRNLQIALNADKHLKLHLKTDGKWGKKTKLAVEKFQKHYGVSPAQGYVGKKTKIALDKVAKNVKLAKVSHSSQTDAKKKVAATSRCYADFAKHTNLRKSYKVFKDHKLLSKANGRNTVLKVDVGEQRVKLLVNGKVALSSPCTTGAKHKLEPNTKTYRDKHTPLGTFKIMEKIAAKKSNIFGEMYRNGKKVYHGDRRKYRGPKAKYVGHTMHHWMRLTSGGIGLHASKYIKRYPGSNGCVRLPFKVAKTVFSKVRPGTKVMVVN
ncbi:L,D-transpeptidase family protein [Sulfurovum sp.]|uniref:L,D-transpeptidase family protein n=1 Tax=Sulfurovum sp. TaxID=1969726 RepID=UPI0025E51ADD|nr:L,D-transpeptidase family protein [Sulfurovum sp.]